MKSLTIVAFAMLISSFVLAAPAPKENKKDLAKFEGTWAFTSWEHFGQLLDADSLESAKWSVKGDKYTFEIDGATEAGTIKLDQSKKPATIDLTITEGSDKGKLQVGIYKIEKDTITICLARPGVKERPTEFKTTEENGQILVTIKKFKKDD